MSKPTDNVVSMVPADENRPVTWNDLQDLRRGLPGYIDVKLAPLENDMKAIKKLLEEKL